MRLLLPVSRDELTDADLDAAYAWPESASWLRANMVSTVDGAARSPQGLSHGISSDADRRVFGRLRGLAGVILVGASTVREEGYGVAKVKPEFAARRAAAAQSAAPPIAVVTRSMSLDLAGPLFVPGENRTIIITCEATDPVALARARSVADVLVCGDDDVDLASAVQQLQARGLGRIHCEGGPHLLAGLAAAGVLDELLLTLSPMLAGGTYDSGTTFTGIAAGATTYARPDTAGTPAGGTTHGVPDIARILAGVPLTDPPATLHLQHIIEDVGTLFLRYTLGS